MVVIDGTTKSIEWICVTHLGTYDRTEGMLEKFKPQWNQGLSQLPLDLRQKISSHAWTLGSWVRPQVDGYM